MSDGIYKTVCVLFIIYGINAIYSGRVYAPGGSTATPVYRDEQPISFWIFSLSYLVIGSAFYYLL
jgi:hypothetical protein